MEELKKRYQQLLLSIPNTFDFGFQPPLSVSGDITQERGQVSVI